MVPAMVLNDMPRYVKVWEGWSSDFSRLTVKPTLEDSERRNWRWALHSSFEEERRSQSSKYVCSLRPWALQ